MSRDPPTVEAVFLSGADVADLAEHGEIVDAVREGYRQHGFDGVAKPRTVLRNVAPSGRMNGYLSILPETGAMGGYVYSAGFESGTGWFMTPLFDAVSGEPLALLDGVTMNPYKTGAVGAVGVDALARKDASVLGVIGSGRQARGQVRSTLTVRDFDEVHVYSPTPEHRESFAAEMDELTDAQVRAVPTSTAAVADADVVITATKASEPVLEGDDLPDGAHVTAVGQYTPSKRELDATTIARSKYVPDLRDRAFQDAGSYFQAVEAGDIPENHVYAGLGDVVSGRVPGRESPDEVTVFDSGGTAIETVATAYLLYEKATERGRGTPIEFTTSSG
jgi:alanine dehydrogenase